MKDSYDDVFKNKNKIMMVFAHPDDMEIVCGGTAARLIADGKKVRVVVATNGGKGMQNDGMTENDFAKLRLKEQIEAGKELGIPESENFNLNIPDAEVEDTVENIEKIVFHIREFQPDIIITHNPSVIVVATGVNNGWVNHRDHRNTASLTFDSAYPYSRDYGFFTNQLSSGKLKPFTVNELMYSDAYTDPNALYFKIDDYLKQKRNALMKHVAPNIAANADEYIEENKMEDGYFEPLGYVKVY